MKSTISRNNIDIKDIERILRFVIKTKRVRFIIHSSRNHTCIEDIIECDSQLNSKNHLYKYLHDILIQHQKEYRFLTITEI